MYEHIIRSLLKEELEPLKNEILQSMKMQREESRYLTRKQVAQYLNIGLSTVDYWTRLGKLTKIRVNGSIRFDKRDVDRIFKSRNDEG